MAPIAALVTTVVAARTTVGMEVTADSGARPVRLAEAVQKVVRRGGVFVAPPSAAAPSAAPERRKSQFHAVVARLREGGIGGESSDGDMERSIITVRRVVAYWKARRRSLRRSRVHSGKVLWATQLTLASAPALPLRSGRPTRCL